MRLSRPRIDPVSDEDASEEQRAILAASGPSPLNVQRTIAQYPELARSRQTFTNHVMRETSLPPREREILILRTGWNCQSEYEFAQHSRFGRSVGLSDEEIRRITLGADAEGWNPFDATLVRAADELHEDAFITDQTWNALAERYSTQQLMDVVFAVGQYHLVSMVLNTFGVQFEPTTTDRFPSE
jgi:alkylhydroperoxidase family enzyme